MIVVHLVEIFHLHLYNGKNILCIQFFNSTTEGNTVVYNPDDCGFLKELMALTSPQSTVVAIYIHSEHSLIHNVRLKERSKFSLTLPYTRGYNDMHIIISKYARE